MHKWTQVKMREGLGNPWGKVLKMEDGSEAEKRMELWHADTERSGPPATTQ